MVKRANGVSRTWSKLENRKRKVEKVVVNLEKRIRLECRRHEEGRGGRYSHVQVQATPISLPFNCL